MAVPEPTAGPPAITAASSPLLSTVGTVASLFGTALTTTAKHYTVGGHAPTWTLKTSILTNIIRHKSGIDLAARQKNPPKTADDILRLARETRESTEKMLAKDADKLEDGVIAFVDIDVKKRKFGGLLAELSAQEDGTRKVKAEWLAHITLLDGTKPLSNMVILSTHGGAHVRCSPATHRAMHTEMSGATECLVFSVDYRLSPEVVFPASLLDTVHAYLYLTEDLGIPSSQILVEGDSAGGHLALQLLMYLRDAGLPQVAGGLLLSPWVDMSSSFASWDENRLIDYLALDDPDDPLRPSRLYLIGADPSKETSYCELLTHPSVSPSLAPLSSLSSLPPLLIQGAGLECLRDEDTVLARRLRKAGNEKVTHQVWMDGVHVFQLLQADRAGKAAMRSLAEWVEGTYGSAKEGGTEWAEKPLALLKAERDARIARVGRIATAKPAAPHGFKWEKTVERLADVGVKKEGAIEAAKQAAEEANAVADGLAQSEAFRPVRA
ncbi:lipase/esterase [Rhodotorula toruloides]|uniref:Lipase/esterase n=1 Tax=Rhodotorula toruloides TaxID=5286 RepID=A0A511KDU6_RHOTO|nr:lipase/esterase [Rhodotorula toruloides]